MSCPMVMIIAAFAICFVLCMNSESAVFEPPGRILRAFAEGYPALETRKFQGISSMAVSEGGRLWITWYAGPTAGEDKNNYVVLATSGDDGETWREVMIVDPDGPGPLRAFDPNVWVDPFGRLWWFWAQAVSHGRRPQTWAMVAEDAEDPEGDWGRPLHIAPGVMMNKPTVLEDGQWLLPVSDWSGRGSSDAATAGVYVSGDGCEAGRCFSFRGAALVPEERTFDEHMLIERDDGDLLMLVRTNYGIGRSVSEDRGRSWSTVEPSGIPHPSSRFFLRRLASGHLLLVKHGPMDERTARSHMTAFISKDGGDSWQGGLLLDERRGISYPDGQQACDGTVYVTYDYSRTGSRSIYMAAFTEEDVLAGENVSGGVRLRELVSEPPPLPPPPAYGPDDFDLDANEDGAEPASPLALLEPEDGGEADTIEPGARLWSNRPNYVLTVLPERLKGKRFIRSEIERSRAVAARPGYVYVIAQMGERGVEKELLEQGFEKTSIPEFIPFFPTGVHDDYQYHDRCSVFQKYLHEGERVEYGKWGITVFAGD